MKPFEERTSEDYQLAAARALTQALALETGTGDPESFLISMTFADELIDHEDGCGQCAMQEIHARVAREMLEFGHWKVSPNPIAEWSERAQAEWRLTKYYRLWEAERRAGRDPLAAFAAKGWEP